MPAPAFLSAFLDDAAILPPTSTSLEQAVSEYAALRAGAHADLVGGFVVTDVFVPDLARVVEAATEPSPTPLAVNLVVTGGAGAIAPAVTWVSRAAGLSLRTVEFALRDEDDLAHNARRLVHVLDSLEEELDDVPVYAEPPLLRGEPTHGWLAALDELASREIALKLRTGGAGEDQLPSAPALATSIDAALDRELPFMCAAGVHHAVRGTDPTTGLAHHGFLNILLATRAALNGHGLDAVTGVLEDTDGRELTRHFAAGPDLAARTRRWFTSCATSSVLEAHQDLVALGLLETV